MKLHENMISAGQTGRVRLTPPDELPAPAPGSGAGMAYASTRLPRPCERRVCAALGLSARDQGLHRHGLASRAPSGHARGGQWVPVLLIRSRITLSIRKRKAARSVAALLRTMRRKPWPSTSAARCGALLSVENLGMISIIRIQALVRSLLVVRGARAGSAGLSVGSVLLRRADLVSPRLDRRDSAAPVRTGDAADGGRRAFHRATARRTVCADRQLVRAVVRRAAMRVWRAPDRSNSRPRRTIIRWRRCCSISVRRTRPSRTRGCPRLRTIPAAARAA